MMASLTSAALPLRSRYASRAQQHLFRSFTTSLSLQSLEAQTTLPPASASAGSSPAPKRKKRNYVVSKKGKVPIENGPDIIGSRRRRLALASSQNIPFSLLPYQCFQEARQVLASDRMEKIKKIEEQRKRISLVAEADAETMGGEAIKKGRLSALEDHLEKLKIWADINDPLVKKRFEDGAGDMTRPIYRFLAKQKWLSMKRKIMVQRLDQMNVVPDIVPYIDPQADISISFGRRNIQPGAIVPSNISTTPPRLDIQTFTKDQKLITVLIIDPDIPNAENDNFDYRCHFLASNIPISPTSGRIHLSTLSTDTQIILPWLVPHAQKGTPWHRLAILILEQPDAQTPIDVEERRKHEVRMGFNTRSFIGRTKCSVLTATLFRNEWDEWTSLVMRNAGLEGGDVEWKRKKSEKLPYKKKDGKRFR